MIKLPMIFSDGCILQQNKRWDIWGTANPNDVIEVSIQGKKNSIKAEKDGSWKLTMPPLIGSDDETLSVKTKGQEIIISKVGIGEVWILGGQSNMEFQMRYEATFSEISNQVIPENIHFFNYPEVSYPEQLTDFDYSNWGKWYPANSEMLEYCSAVGYFFAEKLAEKVKVPIGLVGCNWGGTPACSWMKKSSVEKAGPIWIENYNQIVEANKIGGTNTDNLETYRQMYRKNPMTDRSHPFADEGSDALMYGISYEQQLELVNEMMKQPIDPLASLPNGPMNQNRPGGLYCTMLQQIAPYATKGILWYQGESDAMYPEPYKEMLKALIQAWRELWGEEIPFYSVQLAPFSRWMWCVGADFPKLRKAQSEVERELERVYLVSTADVGMRDDIHPKKKQPVGNRLALRVLENEYNILCESRSPVFSHAERKDGEIVLFFENTYGNMVARGNPAKEFDVLQLENMIEKTEYEIRVEQDLIKIMFHAEVPSEIQILYCWKDYYEGNIYNKADLPLFPFQVCI